MFLYKRETDNDKSETHVDAQMQDYSGNIIYGVYSGRRKPCLKIKVMVALPDYMETLTIHGLQICQMKQALRTNT